MVLGSHQFSRHANQHMHGSRTHRLGRRHFTCATAPLWHRPIYRQWGISPRPETAIASVARAGFHASMPRVIYGGGNAPEIRPGQSSGSTELPALSKVTRFSRQSRETAKGTSQPHDHVLRSLQSSAPFAQSAKQRKGHVFPSTRSFSASRPQGRKRRESGGGTGFLSGTFRRTQRGSAARSAMRSLFACPRTFRRETPVTPPDSRWEF